MISISRRSGIIVACVAVCLSLGIVVALSSNWLSGERFSAYQRARIDRQAQLGTVSSSVISLDTEQNLDFVQFSTPQVGWAGNHDGLLYATEDGGKTWQRRDLKFDVGVNASYFPDIYFGPDSSGLAIAQHYNKPGEEICLSEGSLLRTNDRGQTWQVQFTKKCVELLRITFARGSEGWVLGHQFIQHKESAEGRFLVMHTSDGGNSWVDISEQPNRLMMEWSGRVLESPAGIVATGDGSATLITGNGYLLDATEGGARWHRSGSLAMHRLVPELSAMTDHSLVVSAGYNGEDGTAGMVARRDDHGLWTGSWFKDFFVNDAVFLSDHEIVACGSLLPEEKELLLQGQREGAIIYSRDGGLNWTIVYHSSDRKAVSWLTLGSDGRLWAVGSKGLLIELMPPKNK